MTDNKALSLLETERRYVARELHDGVAQTMQQLGLQVAICQKLLERRQSELLAQELAELERRLQLASEQVRAMVGDMRPPPLEPGAGLIDYIRQAIEIHHQRGGPPVEWSNHLADPPPLSREQLLALARIVQEALLNVRKHARAGRIRLDLSGDAGHLTLLIRDDGQGFDPAAAEAQEGAGLANLRARAALLGGSATISRDAAGEWTEVQVTLPQ